MLELSWVQIMGELIDSRHLFELRGLQADVDRAERTGTPLFHRAFQHMLWGRSPLAAKEYQDAQNKLTDLCEDRLDRLLLADRPIDTLVKTDDIVFPPRPKEKE